MLEIINNLAPFFEDCYRRISVREYAKIIKVSPPTASKLLKKYNKKGLLKKEKDRNYLFFFADKNSELFVDLSRIYWRKKLNKTINKIKNQVNNPVIILFGSLSKAEVKRDSDVDIAVFGEKKKINLNKVEKKIGREIQLFQFKSPKNIKNKELMNNILNGYILSGKIRL